MNEAKHSKYQKTTFIYLIVQNHIPDI